MNDQIPAALGGIASQATAVEQARAVAEVQAAVTVAQSVPRNRGRVVADMQETCARSAVAQQAFYSMPRAGGRVEGATVHLARELARIWGNVDYGVRELRRDDEAGESEIQAYAWDQEGNVRSTRSFIVPHVRMVKKQRSKITDLGDIYLNNQNIGARAVRECIFTILPNWFTSEAEGICKRTLQQGEGEPIESRVAKMVGAFQQYGVTEQMIADRLGRPRTAWTAGDLADLATVHGTLSRGEASPTELFEPPTSAAEKALTTNGELQ
ncbi:MAG: hypothetical protein ACTH9H_13115 [Galactobacter sp.]